MQSKIDEITQKILESPKELDGRALGAVPSPYDKRDFIYSEMVTITEDEEPQDIDFRPYLPPVFDQGKRGSCVACAVAWTPKAYAEIREGNWPEGGLSAAYLYTKCKALDGFSGEGTYPRNAMKVLKDNGICPESVMPYSLLTALNPPRVPPIPAGADAAAAPFKISAYAQIAGSSEKEADRLNIVNTARAALKKEGPFTIAVLVCDNFKPDINGIVPLPYGFVRGGHMLGVVGDKPNMEYTYNGKVEKGCFIIRNTWGAAWGLNGYCYFPYKWFMRVPVDYIPYVMESWTQVDIATVNPDGAYKVIIKPGANVMKVDGKEVALDQPAVIDPDTNRMLAPVRALGEAMNRRVEWINGEAVLTRNTP